jgi:transcriptional regulator with XRE-family HTH domain
MANKTEIDNKAVGQRIREERKKFDLSREEFAEIVELSDYYVGQLERGERQMSLPVLARVAKSLHIPLDYLIFGKTFDEQEIIKENRKKYERRDKEINELLDKCSLKELELVKKLIKTVLPYVNIE